jgi:hypothetical protein
MANKIPNPWISASFFAWAVLFALWQPSVWWRGLAAALGVALGFWGLHLWWRNRGKDFKHRSSETLRKGPSFTLFGGLVNRGIPSPASPETQN